MTSRDGRTALPPWVRPLLFEIVGFIVALFAIFHVAKALRSFIIILLISLFLSIASP
jgi:hypothetical protein